MCWVSAPASPQRHGSSRTRPIGVGRTWCRRSRVRHPINAGRQGQACNRAWRPAVRCVDWPECRAGENCCCKENRHELHRASASRCVGSVTGCAWIPMPECEPVNTAASFRFCGLPLPAGRVFLPEFVGVKCARRRCDPGQDRQGEYRGNDGFHDRSPFSFAVSCDGD